MDMEHFYAQLTESALTAFTRFNQTTAIETKRISFSAGSIAISVVRGNLLEKAATAHIKLRTKNPETGKDTHFDVLQIKTYPANPTVPILLVNIEHRVAGDERFGGFLDLAPVAMGRHDLASLQKKIKTLTEDYGGDYESLRKKVATMYKRDHWKNALNAGIGIRLELSSEQSDLVKEAGNKWLEWYCGLLEKTAPKPFTRDEEALMYQVRSGILEFYMLQDRSFQIIQELGVPLETMALAHFAPTIHY
jgi:coproporphyrinogen III oxidase